MVLSDPCAILTILLHYDGMVKEIIKWLYFIFLTQPYRYNCESFSIQYGWLSILINQEHFCHLSTSKTNSPHVIFLKF